MTIHLEDLPQKVPCLDNDWCSALVKSAVVCLTSKDHKSNVVMTLARSNVPNVSTSVGICWTMVVSVPMGKTFTNEQDTTDAGAVALALLLTLYLTEYTGFEVSCVGTCIDYWLTKTDEFSISARLEVSGIRHKTAKNTINSRLKSKIKQVSQSDHTGLPVYIAIIEFSEPQALYILREPQALQILTGSV